MEEIRKLATIRTIDNIESIPEADKIELATVDGWEVVVKKNEFNIGDLCVYIEIDSILPDMEPYEFMRNRKFRVKTIKLRGKISQGIVFPMSVFDYYRISRNKYKLGDNVTEVLKVIKYNPQANKENKDTLQDLGSIKKTPYVKFLLYCKKRKYLRWITKILPIPIKKKIGFPDYIPKTDENRVQNLTRYLNKWSKEEYYVTEKLDGQSATYYINGKTIGVCSRNICSHTLRNNNYWRIEQKYNIIEFMKNKQKEVGDFYIQGEIVGPTVQGNKYKLKELELFVFTIFLLKENRYLTFDEMAHFLSETDIHIVPLLYITLDFSSAKSIVNSSIGHSTIANIKREGIVIRSTSTTPNRYSFKAVNPEFLLKYDS